MKKKPEWIAPPRLRNRSRGGAQVASLRCPPHRPEFSSLRTAAAVRALGAVLRRSPQAPRTRAVESMLRAVRKGDPRIRSAALRALGFLEEPAAGAALELELGLQRAASVPAADLVFALCRSGSPRAGEALEALIVSRRATDLWIAAACAAEMAPAVRSRIWARVQDGARALANVAIRRTLMRSVDWLREHALEESVVALDAGSYWTRAGITLHPGDRFRIEAYGLLSIQRAAGANDPEAAPDLFGPEGRELPPYETQRMSALIARVGRHEIPAPIDPEQVFVAQDDGELVVRIAPANLEALEDSWGECGSALPTDVVSTVPVSGLILVRARKLP